MAGPKSVDLVLVSRVPTGRRACKHLVDPSDQAVSGLRITADVARMQVNDVVRVSYALHLLGVFPLIHFAFREVVDALIFPSAPSLAHSPMRFYGITAALLTLTFIGSAFVPNIWVAFEFTGATAAVSLGFTFPALIAWRWGAKLAGSRER